MAAIPQVFVGFIEEMRVEAPSLEITQMFGKPCAKLGGGKPVLSFFQDSTVFKLGAPRVQEIYASHPEAVPFDSSGKGRPFKEWVQVPEGIDRDWQALAREALGLR